MKCADAPGGLRACRTYFVVLIIANCDLAVAWVVLPGVKCRYLYGDSGCSAAQHEQYESNSHRWPLRVAATIPVPTILESAIRRRLFAICFPFWFHQRVKRFLKL